MRKFLVILFFCLFNLAVKAEVYKVSVKRLESNVYQDTSSKSIIITKYCYEYAYDEEAVLFYDKYSYDNKLVFKNSGTSCEVKTVQ